MDEKVQSTEENLETETEGEMIVDIDKEIAEQAERLDAQLIRIQSHIEALDKRIDSMPDFSWLDTPVSVLFKRAIIKSKK